MKSALILFFSGTGNTWWTSVKLAELLKKQDFEAAALSIEAEEKYISRRIIESDIIFLNYPVYGSDRPEIVKDFINRLPENPTGTQAKPLGIICTQLAYSGDGAWLEHEMLENRGYRIDWAMHLPMPNNISIPGFPFGYTNDQARLEKKLNKAEVKLKKLTEKISKGIPERHGTTFISKCLGLMQRAPYRKMFPGWRNDVAIDPVSCTKCGKCIKLCPVDNIRFADEAAGGFPEFQGSCILCLRCYNFCPTQSVLYRNTKFKPGKGTESIPYTGPVEIFDPQILKKNEEY